MQSYHLLFHLLGVKHVPAGDMINLILYIQIRGLHTANCAAVSAKSSMSLGLNGVGRSLVRLKITASMRFRSKPSSAVQREDEPEVCDGDSARVVNGGEGVERRGLFRCLWLEDAEDDVSVCRLDAASSSCVAAESSICIRSLNIAYVESFDDDDDIVEHKRES